jgi:DedD protein
MSQKTDNLIKLALVFFVSLLSFSIGTYVGKKYSDNQYKLAALEPKKSETETEHGTTAKAQEFAADAQDHEHTLPTGNIDEITTSNEKPGALTDSEVAKIAEEFAAEEDTEETLVQKPTPAAEKEEVVGTIKATPRPVAKMTLADAVKQQAKPVAKAPSVEKPLVSIKSADLGVTATPTDREEVREPASIAPKQEVMPMHFTVQIGSFPTQGEAEKLTKTLQDKGFKTSYIPAKVNGQVWYRVNVGLFGTIKEAQDYKKEFLEKTKMSSAIVQRVQH